MRLGVFELDSLDSTKVVEVSRVLVVRNVLWESCLNDELTGLLIQVLREV